MGMMMGMMGAPPMGMHPPMGVPPMMMPPMGMPGMAPFPCPGAGPAAPKQRKRRRRSKSSSNSSSASPAEEEDERSAEPEKPRKRRRQSQKVEEVEQWLMENDIKEEAILKVRALSPDSQRQIIARPLTGDVQNPSKVVIARVRELQAQNERSQAPPHMAASDPWNLWANGACGGAMAIPAKALDKYVEDNELDDGASRQLRSMPPHHQAAALQWDLSKSRNPSAKFMSKAASLAKSMPPMMPFGGMMMPGMPPMMPMGMPCGPPMSAIPGPSRRR